MELADAVVGFIKFDIMSFNRKTNIRRPKIKWRCLKCKINNKILGNGNKICSKELISGIGWMLPAYVISIYKFVHCGIIISFCFFF